MTEVSGEYEQAEATAKAASFDDVAIWLEGMHDYAKQKDQPWLARAAEILRGVRQAQK